MPVKTYLTARAYSVPFDTHQLNAQTFLRLRRNPQKHDMDFFCLICYM